MSLVKRIKSDAKLRKKIDATFARPRPDITRVRMVEPLPLTGSAYRPARVGTAFDYLLRLVLRHRNPDAAVVDGPWIAELPSVKDSLLLDSPYGDHTHDEIRGTLRDGYRWRKTDHGLDCMSIDSALSRPDNPWLRNMKDPNPRAALRTGGLNLQDKWMAKRLRENKSLAEIVEILFLSVGEQRERIREYREAIAGARYFGERYVRTGEMPALLPRYLLKMSSLDALYRTDDANFLPPNVDPYFSEPIPQPEVDDLIALYKAIPEHLFRGDRVFLNPNLSIQNRGVRRASRKLATGGVKADADLIINDLLIDLKTSDNNITPLLPLQDFCQLMGYFCLTSLAGEHKVRRLGIYYARFGYLFEFPIPRARPGMGGRTAFMKWFRKHMQIDEWDPSD